MYGRKKRLHPFPIPGRTGEAGAPRSKTAASATEGRARTSPLASRLPRKPLPPGWHRKDIGQISWETTPARRFPASAREMHFIGRSCLSGKKNNGAHSQCTPPFCLFFFSHSGPGSFYGLCLRKPQILNQGRRPSGTFPVKRYRRSFCRPGIIVPTLFLFVKQIRQIFSSFSKIFVFSNKFIKNPLCTFCRSVVYCMTSKSRPPHEALLSKGADV